MTKTNSLKTAAETVAGELGITARLEQLQAERERVAAHAEQERQRLTREASELSEKLRPLADMEQRRDELKNRVENLAEVRAELQRKAGEINERVELHLNSGRCDASFIGPVRDWFTPAVFDSVVHGLPRVEAALAKCEKELADTERAIATFKKANGVQ
jgi:hypothetical protein